MKRPAKKSKTSARKTPRAARSSLLGVSIEVDANKESVEAALGAAYMMMDRAFVALDGRRDGALTVYLRSKQEADPADLRRAFQEELRAQKLRWAIARNNQPIREFLVDQAIAVAHGAPPPAAPAGEGAASEQLSDEQRREIESLIAEVEAEIKSMNDKKAVADPKNLKASWEARQEKPAA